MYVFFYLLFYLFIVYSLHLSWHLLDSKYIIYLYRETNCAHDNKHMFWDILSQVHS